MMVKLCYNQPYPNSRKFINKQVVKRYPLFFFSMNKNKRVDKPPTSNVRMKKKREKQNKQDFWLNNKEFSIQENRRHTTKNSLQFGVEVDDKDTEGCYTSFRGDQLNPSCKYFSSRRSTSSSSTSQMGRSFNDVLTEKSDYNWFLNPRNLESWNENSNIQAFRRDRNGELLSIDDDIRDFKMAEVKAIQANAYSRSAKISPYEEKLFELRRNKLKLEEAFLLKTKCDQELERTRFPAPKWYELKTKQFTVEMTKHNNFMRNEADLDMDGLMKYRFGLFKKSKEYSQFST